VKKEESQIDLPESSSLPKGLVGPASTVMVKLNGQECQALLDTGSQVTILFDNWFSRNPPDVPIHPLTGLSIWGLSLHPVTPIRAKGVEHQIRLRDNKPFREHSRCIAPADIEDYTTPRIDDAMDCLVGSKWFSVLDLCSGYYQIAMVEEDKEKMAFICPLGFFQFERMLQGITGAPATFRRLMEKA
ncbi:hypothetical protein QTP86_019012, partial [Hemibagrus guttatus]